jgi:hypothetical protein
MRGIGRVCGAALVAVVAASGWASSAQAAPFEPNDSVLQATGPLSGATNYDGAIETDNDVDYFFFNTVGQRQLDVSVTELAGNCTELTLRDSEGEYITNAYLDSTITHLLRTAPSAVQYVLQVDGFTGCAYRLRIDPGDAVTTVSPGIVASFGGGNEADDAQRVLVDGRLIGEVHGTTGGSFMLGHLPPTSRITFEAENFTGDWSYDAQITNQQDRIYSTVFSETADQEDSGTRVGVVRRVVMTPSGSPLESCGEVFASITCIPIDRDGDGFASDRDCDDASAKVHPGAREVLDNATDENCDGIAGRRPRVASTVKLRRRGAKHTGRVTSSNAQCVAGRRVLLRRKGSGTKRFGAAYTTATGRFTIRRAHRIRGRIYAVATQMRTADVLCRKATSKKIRG